MMPDDTPPAVTTDPAEAERAARYAAAALLAEGLTAEEVREYGAGRPAEFRSLFTRVADAMDALVGPLKMMPPTLSRLTTRLSGAPGYSTEPGASATYQPRPGQRSTSPASASIPMAFCTVSRLTSYSSAIAPMLRRVCGASVPSVIRCDRSA